MAEVIGEQAWLDRKPMVEGALAGERQFFVAELRSSDARAARRPVPIMCRGSVPAARSIGFVVGGQGRDRAARRRARDEGERGAVPADRQLRAGDDVGDAARPRARLRQRRLCRVRLRARRRPRGRRGRSTGARGSIPTTSTGSSPRASPAKRSVKRVHARGALPALDGEWRWLRIGLAAALRRRRGAGRLHRGRRATSRSPRKRSSSFGGWSRSRRRELALAKRASARCSTRCSRSWC